MKAGKLTSMVPQLRFPEFHDKPGWDEVTLGTLLERSPNYGVNAPAVAFSESLPTYIRITDINDDGQFESRTRVSVDIDANDEQYLEDGDIVLARTGASVGKSYRYREEDGLLVYAGFLIRVRPNLERLLSQFLAAYLSTSSYWDWVRVTSARSGQPGINSNEYASMPLPIPPDRRILAEQQRIADCLGSLDGLIAAQGRKLETLRQHKQGLMQQLFPRPGETVPQLRFPEFRDAGEWKRDNIGSIASISKGKGVSKAEIAKNGLTSCIRYAELYTHYGEVIREVRSRTNIPPEDLVLSQAGDVIVPASGETRADIARAACVVPEGIALGGDLNILRLELNGLFFSYLLNSPLRYSIAQLAQGDTVAHLYPRQLSRVSITYPSPTEQQRIADCLGSLDGLIAAQGRKLDTLRQHKQGLMQQLFPSQEAIES